MWIAWQCPSRFVGQNRTLERLERSVIYLFNVSNSLDSGLADDLDAVLGAWVGFSKCYIDLLRATTSKNDFK